MLYLSRKEVKPSERIASLIAEMREFSEEQLIEAVKAGIGQTVEGWCQAAAGIHVLETKGFELGQLRILGLSYYRKLARGSLLPELLQEYGFSNLLRRVAQFPIEEQKMIADGKPVPVVELRDGEVQRRFVPPKDLSPIEVRQVFSSVGIKTDTEQLTWIRSEQLRARLKAETPGVQRETHHKKGKVELHGIFSVLELRRIVARLEATKSQGKESA